MLSEHLSTPPVSFTDVTRLRGDAREHTIEPAIESAAADAEQGDLLFRDGDECDAFETGGLRHERNGTLCARKKQAGSGEPPP